jgi:hypothetical protein
LPMNKNIVPHTPTNPRTGSRGTRGKRIGPVNFTIAAHGVQKP